MIFKSILRGLAVVLLLASVAAAQGGQSPILAPIGSQTVAEAQLLTFTVSATDPQGTTPSLGAAPLPTGATRTRAPGPSRWPSPWSYSW